jgi:hypothetical protein
MKICTYSNELIQLEQKDYCYLEELYFQWIKQKNLKLDKKSSEILKYFIFNEINSSPYKCHKYLVTNNIIKLDPKNIRRRVQKLYELDLLEVKEIVTKGGRRLHNATFYKLSPFGVFYILKKGLLNDLFHDSAYIIYKYKNFQFYNIILYRFLKLETIESIVNEHIINKILIYLHRVSLMIENIFFLVKKNGNMDIFEIYFELFYKHEMRDHLLELVIGILSFNNKSCFSKNTDDGDLYPNIRLDLIQLNKDEIFINTVDSLQQYAMDLYNDFKKLKAI